MGDRVAAASSGLYALDGSRYVPQTAAAGPWLPGSQAGGALCALVAHLAERHDEGSAFVTRLTIELMRTVPLRDLRAEVTATQTTRRLERLRIMLFAEGIDEPVLIAHALRLPPAVVSLPDGAAELDLLPPRPGPEDLPAARVFDPGWANFLDVVDARYEGGRGGGPRAGWFRLRCPLLVGGTTSSTVAAVALADLPLGGPSLRPSEYVAMNPDLTVYFHRPPEGEWIAMEGMAWAQPTGVGFAEAALFDRRGRVGRQAQCRVVRKMGRRT